MPEEKQEPTVMEKKLQMIQRAGVYPALPITIFRTDQGYDVRGYFVVAATTATALRKGISFKHGVTGTIMRHAPNAQELLDALMDELQQRTEVPCSQQIWTFRVRGMEDLIEIEGTAMTLTEMAWMQRQSMPLKVHVAREELAAISGAELFTTILKRLYDVMEADSKFDYPLVNLYVKQVKVFEAYGNSQRTIA